MIPYDSQVTTIDLTAGAAMQVARGSVVSDTRGVRQATLLFAQGTRAEMVLPNGVTQTLATLNVRATEYTVEPNGPDAMPAELPANSGYTYAAEFSVDEAVAAGALDVRFDRPVIVYLENFIGFPAGVLVPVGYYDRSRGQWIGIPNGRVVRLLSNTGGQASLDIDGDGTADPAAALAALGITDAELRQLATLYQPGQTLWRVALTHFTPWDCNWPYGPPPGADYPPTPKPLHDEDHRPDKDDDCYEFGSVIGCLSRTLGEAVAIVGTPFRLHYSSDRVPGRRGADTLAIPLTDATVPASLINVHLDVNVAGQTASLNFPPQPNQTFVYEWDGRDGYDRPVTANAPIFTTLYYRYNWEYYPTRAQFETAFAASPAFARYPLENPGGGTFTERVAVRDQPLSLISGWNGARRMVGSADTGGWDARGQGLGGWTLNVHHAYDPRSGILYYGDGRQRSAQSLNLIIARAVGAGREGGWPCAGVPAGEVGLRTPIEATVGPDGSLYIVEGNRICRIGPDGMAMTIAGADAPGYSGDGGPAIQAQLNAPSDIAFAPDGSLYIADTDNNRVRRIGLDGVITTVAGDGQADDGGDGGLAIQAQLTPYGVAVGADGHIFIAGNNRIRRVAPDGYITTMAGTGVAGYSGDDGPATQAELNGPWRVAVDGRGVVYIADTGNHRIRQVTPFGFITTAAGSGAAGSDGDGGPAIHAQLNAPTGLALGADGSLYIADTDNRRVRWVQPDGVMTTIAGNGSCCYGGDNGPATQARLGVVLGLARAPDGSLYLVDSYEKRVRRVALPMPDFGADLAIPSEDGAQIFRFDANGRHLRTLNALTGGVLYQFVYDGGGRLVEVHDGDGNVTTIIRDADGNPTHLVGPYGHTTTTTLAANGYLVSVAGPTGATTRFDYTSDGLLAGLTDPNGGVYHFTYDALGRLVREEDPAGGVKTLARVESANGYTVTLTSPMSRPTIYSVEWLDDGATRRINSDRYGASTEVLTLADGSQTAIYPDGAVISLQRGPDPRFGMQAPLVQEMTIAAPDGRTRSFNAQRYVYLANANDPLSLTVQQDYISINGRTFVRSYDAANRTVTSITAAGRETVAALDAQGRLLSHILAPTIAPVTLSYDSRGRPLKAVQGEQSWTYTYDSAGRVATRVDAAGRQTGYAYDASDRLLALTLPGGAAYHFSYDAGDNLTQIGMPGGVTHTLGYTAVDLDAAYTPPTNASYTWQYDADRALTQTALPGGRTVDYSYDAAGRLKGLNYPEATVQFEYAAGDATDRTSRMTRVGAGGAFQQIALTYAAERLTRATWSGAAQGQFTYSYDNNFFLTGVNFTGGADTLVTALARDADGLLIGYGPFNITRNGPAGAPGSLGNGAFAVTFGYDLLGRVVTRTHTLNGQLFYQLLLNYDAVGRIAARRETAAGATTLYSYTYALDGQLTAVQRDTAPAERYTYDANGNRTSRQYGANPAEVATYDGQDRLLGQGAVAYQFDADGFLNRRGGDLFRYSARGELLTVTLAAGQSIVYTYDALGRRTARTDASGVHQYLYGDPGDPLRITAVRDPDGNLSTLYYDDAGLLFALQRGGAWYYVAADQVGSPRVVKNTAGQTVKTLVYDSFGRLLVDSNPAFDLPIGFAGGLADPTSGLVRFGYRDYDPQSGRWTARDPALFGGGQGNLYAYAGSDPIGRRDPSGLFCIGSSLYRGIGGGVQTCIDDDGVSVCAEVGFGVGADAGIDTGGIAESGAEFGGELKVKCGPVGLGVGFSLDNAGCLKFGPKGEVGPLTFEKGKQGLQPEIEGGPELNISAKCSAQGRIYGKVCKQVKY
jgi:RHS repeat-associated protein